MIELLMVKNNVRRDNGIEQMTVVRWTQRSGVCPDAQTPEST